MSPALSRSTAVGIQAHTRISRAHSELVPFLRPAAAHARSARGRDGMPSSTTDARRSARRHAVASGDGASIHRHLGVAQDVGVPSRFRERIDRRFRLGFVRIGEGSHRLAGGVPHLPDHFHSDGLRRTRRTIRRRLLGCLLRVFLSSGSLSLFGRARDAISVGHMTHGADRSRMSRPATQATGRRCVNRLRMARGKLSHDAIPGPFGAGSMGEILSRAGHAARS